jgi:3-phenylpropionate/trans-cinnamate dioxygenase ferredoxin subunit
VPERITIARTSDIPQGRGVAIDVEGLRLAVFNVNGEYFAMDDRCTHAEASLSQGDCDDETVECPLHGARFDLRTGDALTAPADTPVQTYKVHVAGDELQIEVG